MLLRQLLPTACFIASIFFHGILFRSPAWKAASLIPGGGSFQGQKSVGDDNVKVQVKVLVESLCVYSKRFFRDQLVPTFHVLGNAGIMELQVVTFGNAHVTYDAKTGKAQSIQCQHGDAECDVHAYELCAADIYPAVSQYLPFISCLFKTLPMGSRNETFDTSNFADCSRRSDLSFDEIALCRNDQMRVLDLQIKAQRATPKYHEYVPWVEVNGKHMNEKKKRLAGDSVQSFSKGRRVASRVL